MAGMFCENIVNLPTKSTPINMKSKLSPETLDQTIAGLFFLADTSSAP